MVMKKKYPDNDADSQSVGKHDDIRSVAYGGLLRVCPFPKAPYMEKLTQMNSGAKLTRD